MDPNPFLFFSIYLALYFFEGFVVLLVFELFIHLS